MYFANSLTPTALADVPSVSDSVPFLFIAVFMSATQNY